MVGAGARIRAPTHMVSRKWPGCPPDSDHNDDRKGIARLRIDLTENRTCDTNPVRVQIRLVGSVERGRPPQRSELGRAPCREQSIPSLDPAGCPQTHRDLAVLSPGADGGGRSGERSDDDTSRSSFSARARAESVAAGEAMNRLAAVRAALMGLLRGRVRRGRASHQRPVPLTAHASVDTGIALAQLGAAGEPLVEGIAADRRRLLSVDPQAQAA